MNTALPLKLTMKLVDVTKGAGRYTEVIGGQLVRSPADPGAKIGTLYVRKAAYNGGELPEAIHVTVEAAL